MHRAYQPLKPCTNKYLQKKWDQDNYEQHRSKVREARAVVDTKGASTPVQVQLKLKKHQLKEERLSIIERDNRLLSIKLLDIARSKGLMDHRNHYSERSLNGAKRRGELLLVTHENQAILQRISARQSEYRRHHWEEHWERVECCRDNISRYPHSVAPQRPKRSVRFMDFECENSRQSGQSSLTTGQDEKSAQHPARHMGNQTRRQVKGQHPPLPPLKGTVRQT
ncbi:hypothetical protein GN956_G20215 [Arapaima gigas]